MKISTWVLVVLCAVTLCLGCGRESDAKGSGGSGGQAGEGGSGGEQAGEGGSGGEDAVGAVSLVFIQDRNLYGALIDQPGETRKLSNITGSDDLVARFSVSPDGRFVAYRAVTREPECCQEALLTTRVDKISERLRIDRPPGSIQRVDRDFSWSPDGSRLSYRADQSEGPLARSEWRIFTSRPDGSGNAAISNEALRIAAAQSESISWSPDGSRLAYLGYDEDLGLRVLHTNTADGSSDQRIGASKQLWDFTWSFDGAMLAYAELETQETTGIFANNATGTAEVRVTDQPIPHGPESFAWNADGSRLAYLTTREDGVTELYTRAADGSDERNMTGTLQQIGALGFQWSSNGRRIAYSAYQDRDEHPDLYTSDADGSNNRRINLASNDKGVESYHYRWSPTGDWLAYISDNTEEKIYCLYVSAGDASDRVRLNAPEREVGVGVDGIQWSPDGAHIAFRERNEIGNEELFSSFLDGSNRHKVSGDFPDRGRDVSEFRWSTDGAHIAYTADQDEPDLIELYTSARDGSANQKVSIPGREVERDFRWVPSRQ